MKQKRIEFLASYKVKREFKGFPVFPGFPGIPVFPGEREIRFLSLKIDSHESKAFISRKSSEASIEQKHREY